MKLFLLLPVLFVADPAIAADSSPEAESLAAKKFAERLQQARPWSSEIEVLKTIAWKKKRGAYAIPELRRYIAENADAKCGSRLALRMAELTLEAVTDGDAGIARYLKTGTASPGSGWACEFAKDLIEEKEFVPLFDGESLKMWEGKERVFRIEDSAIVAGSLKSNIPNNEFLCTRKTYENFELRLQARLKGEGKNAGIQFRSKRIPDHHEVIGYQADMGVMGKAHSIWGALYDESRRRKFLAEGDQEEIRKRVKTTRWNDFVIRCEGPRIQIWVNEVQTVDYTEKDSEIATSGIIGLQIHSGPPAEAWYRNIRIRELKVSDSK